jgi:hypothetical protein
VVLNVLFHGAHQALGLPLWRYRNATPGGRLAYPIEAGRPSRKSETREPITELAAKKRKREGIGPFFCALLRRFSWKKFPQEQTRQELLAICEQFSVMAEWAELLGVFDDIKRRLCDNGNA